VEGRLGYVFQGLLAILVGGDFSFFCIGCCWLMNAGIKLFP